MQVWITYFKAKYCFIIFCFSHVCLFVSVCVWFYWAIIQNKRQNIFLSVHHGQKHLKNHALPQPVPLFCSTSNWMCYCQKLPPPQKHSCLSSPSLSSGDGHWLILELVCLCVDELTGADVLSTCPSCVLIQSFPATKDVQWKCLKRASPCNFH